MRGFYSEFECLMKKAIQNELLQTTIKYYPNKMKHLVFEQGLLLISRIQLYDYHRIYNTIRYIYKNPKRDVYGTHHLIKSITRYIAIANSCTCMCMISTYKLRFFSRRFAMLATIILFIPYLVKLHALFSLHYSDELSPRTFLNWLIRPSWTHTHLLFRLTGFPLNRV